MNLRVLDRASDLLLGDWVDKSDKDQVEIEELLLALEQELEDDKTKLDVERQEL
jgi:hypothetical protein